MMFLDNGEEKLKKKTSSYNQMFAKKQKEKKGFGLAIQYQVHLREIPCLVQRG
jgi:hypothetical protein